MCSRPDVSRKFDYAFPNQCAAVSVADDRDDAPWQDAGTWYAAGSDTVVHSNPREELGATRHEVQTSNRPAGTSAAERGSAARSARSLVTAPRAVDKPVRRGARCWLTPFRQSPPRG